MAAASRRYGIPRAAYQAAWEATSSTPFRSRRATLSWHRRSVLETRQPGAHLQPLPCAAIGVACTISTLGVLRCGQRARLAGQVTRPFMAHQRLQMRSFDQIRLEIGLEVRSGGSA
jgi:hypothetical protein